MHASPVIILFRLLILAINCGLLGTQAFLLMPIRFDLNLVLVIEGAFAGFFFAVGLLLAVVGKGYNSGKMLAYTTSFSFMTSIRYWNISSLFMKFDRSSSYRRFKVFINVLMSLAAPASLYCKTTLVMNSAQRSNDIKSTALVLVVSVLLFLDLVFFLCPRRYSAKSLLLIKQTSLSHLRMQTFVVGFSQMDSHETVAARLYTNDCDTVPNHQHFTSGSWRCQTLSYLPYFILVAFLTGLAAYYIGNKIT